VELLHWCDALEARLIAAILHQILNVILRSPASGFGSIVEQKPTTN
jgi:hypothetical protein